MSKLNDRETTRESVKEILSGTKAGEFINRLDSGKRTHEMTFHEIKIKSGFCLQARCIIRDRSPIVTIGEATVAIKGQKSSIGFHSWELDKRTYKNRTISAKSFFRKHAATA